MSADFRAAERLAQLIVQVAGRSGRAHKPGEVLLQTHLPEHPLLQVLLTRGYAEFARRALAEREPAHLPPISHALVIRAEHENGTRAETFLAAVLAAARPALDAGVEISGPLPAPQPRRQDRWRFQLIAMATERAPLHRFAERAVNAGYQLAKDRQLRWHIDVDPLDFG